MIIIPELWLGPDEHLARPLHRGHPPRFGINTAAVRTSIRSVRRHCCSRKQALLDGRDATSHWGYQQLFEERYPRIRFRPEPNLCFADETGRLVTAGGATSWHDLVLHVISRHVSPGEALRISKVYLLKAHDEGQLPYRALVRPRQHPDSAVRDCELWLDASLHAESSAVSAQSAIRASPARRTLKRRFKSATGLTLIDYLQNLRIEQAKNLLETSRKSVDDISAAVGYEDASFFRRLFRRRAGLSPARYRRMFQRTSRN